MIPDVPDLTRYDLILVNTSGGKDSALTAWYVTQLAEAFGVKKKVVAAHATFKEEWPGTVELVHRQCEALGIPLHVVRRDEDLLDYVRRRGKWPSARQRYCTSDFKRGPIKKLTTALAPRSYRTVRVLNIFGFRSEESPARAKHQPFTLDKARSNGARTVWTWLPIFTLRVHHVWKLIAQHSIEMHPAYADGMPRLSCRFCIFAPRDALLRAGQLNPEMLDAYVQVEQEIGHTFRENQSITEIRDALNRGEVPKAIADWRM